MDLKRQLAGYAAVQGRFDVITLPPRRYLTIDGNGDPNTAPAYADALASLFPLAYAIKFFSKRELGRDYGVMPLEGLWWADDMANFTTRRDKSTWHWTLLNLVPDWITAEHVEEARRTVAAKGAAPMLEAVRLATIDEGLCVQTLHIGSYDDEAPVLRRLHDEFLPAQRLRPTGRHHEIYLSDARRTAADKLRTILRQPASPVIPASAGVSAATQP